MKKPCLPATAYKTEQKTCDKTNWKIREQTTCFLNMYKDADSIMMTDRISELDHEWDVERVLETNAASLVLAGSLLGYKLTKSGLFIMTGAVGLFLLQHALFGWCPPLPLIRSLGVRTANEISDEKIVLKHLRGDFANLSDLPEELLAAAEKQ